MWLIDADALKKSFQDSYNGLKRIYDGLQYDDEKRICAAQLTTFTEAILRVKEMPTIEAEPVKRGKWLAYPSDFYMKCSVCGCEYEKQRMPQEVGWCPNPKCGAKMELEGK